MNYPSPQAYTLPAFVPSPRSLLRLRVHSLPFVLFITSAFTSLEVITE